MRKPVSVHQVMWWWWTNMATCTFWTAAATHFVGVARTSPPQKWRESWAACWVTQMWPCMECLYQVLMRRNSQDGGKTYKIYKSSAVNQWMVFVCRSGGEGWHGSDSSRRRHVGPWKVPDGGTKSPALLRTARLPSTYANRRHYRCDNNLKALKHKTLKNANLFYFSLFLFSGTFKIKKTRLQKEGYKPQDKSEKIYFLNSRAGCYKLVTEELYEAIVKGKVSLWDENGGQCVWEVWKYNCVLVSFGFIWTHF